MAVVGIIPAAGHATRLQPIFMSKEILPIGGRPVMDYLIERMRAAPCSELRVVTRPDKEDVTRHAEAQGAVIVHARPKSVSESLLAAMRDLAPTDIVLFGFPDTIWEPVDGYRRILEALDRGYDIALGLFRTDEPERADVVRFTDSWLITAVEVKSETPSSNWVWGCGAARVRALEGVGSQREPGVYFDSYCKTREVIGVWLSDSIVDIGTKESLRQMSGGELPLEDWSSASP
jgi:glucose-1-phosphate thymidylyltransferase